MEIRAGEVSEASVSRLLKAYELIASPPFIAINAADAFKNKTTALNQLWQTDSAYLKVIGWGWFYLSTVARRLLPLIVAWKLCTQNVTATLDLALQASGLHELSGYGSCPTAVRSYVAGHLAKWLGDGASSTCAARPTTRYSEQDRALARDARELHSAEKLLPEKSRSRPLSATTTTADAREHRQSQIINPISQPPLFYPACPLFYPACPSQKFR
jgi:putative transposase